MEYHEVTNCSVVLPNFTEGYADISQIDDYWLLTAAQCSNKCEQDRSTCTFRTGTSSGTIRKDQFADMKTRHMMARIVSAKPKLKSGKRKTMCRDVCATLNNQCYPARVRREYADKFA